MTRIRKFSGRDGVPTTDENGRAEPAREAAQAAAGMTATLVGGGGKYAEEVAGGSDTNTEGVAKGGDKNTRGATQAATDEGTALARGSKNTKGARALGAAEIHTHTSYTILNKEGQI